MRCISAMLPVAACFTALLIGLNASAGSSCNLHSCLDPCQSPWYHLWSNRPCGVQKA